MANVVINFL